MSVVVVKTRSSFEAIFPPSIIFGAGVAARAPEQAKKLGISKVLVVTDKGVANTEGCKALVEGLKAGGVNPTVWSEVQADPPDTSIKEGVKVYLDGKCDGLIAIGGGSSIDTTKCIGVVALNGGRVNDYSVSAPTPKPIVKVPPLITIPTTAGTGSEVTHYAVITDTSQRLKFFLANPLLFPRVALIDPSLALSLPPNQTMSTGLDAFCHAVEAYISTLEGPISDAFALYTVELVAQNLRRAVYNGSDIEARTNMALASLMAGLCIVNGLVCVGHCVGERIGARYHTPHGMACALTFPAGLEYLRPAKQEKLGKLAEAMGVKTAGMSDTEAAQAFIEAVSQLMSDIGVPTLAEATGMKESDVASFAEICFTHPVNSCNPRPCTAETYAEILKKTLEIS